MIHPVVAAALSDLNKPVREDAGSNRSKSGAIEEAWRFTEIPNGWEKRYPYCAAKVSEWCANAGFAWPRTCSVYRMVKQAQGGKTNGVSVTWWAGTVIPEPGWLVIVDTAQAGKWNHVGIVEDAVDPIVTTIEANVTASVSRSNDGAGKFAGVWRKQRAIGSVSGYIELGSPGTETISEPIGALGEFLNALEMAVGPGEIRGFQRLVNALGETPSLVEDGKMGPKTNAALKRLHERLYRIGSAAGPRGRE